MKNLLTRNAWSPYAVGAGIGVLSWITFFAMGKALGVSTTFVRAVGAAEHAIAPEHVASNAYFAKYLDGKSPIEWQFALVVFLLVGGFLAARLGQSQRGGALPALWSARFGERRGLRHVHAFLGGFLVLFGARLAGGCTSGHGISGALQFAASSWITLVAIFAGGILTARLFHGRSASAA